MKSLLALLAVMALLPASANALAVTGFQAASSPVSAIDRSARALSTVGVDGVNLISHGEAVSAAGSDARGQLARAHHDGLRAELVVGNFDDHINDFSEPLAHGLLGRRTAITAVTRELAAEVSNEGWDGISIDLESLTARDESGLTAFVTALRAALPAGDTISICIQNADSAAAYPAMGYDLSALGATVSRVILMAYDQHGPWENTPGPVGALAWQRSGLRVLLRSVSASHVDLGVAGYGYAWRPHSNVMLSDASARALVARNHVRPRFVQRVGEWTATLPDGTVLWWSDARSFTLRVALAQSLGLHGLAVWSLGLSDPITA